MTREEAITKINRLRNEYNDQYIDYCGTNEAVNMAIEALKAEPVRHGRWIKMSDADGVYYACSECGGELPRVINSFNPQFDLFPKLKCIDKTTYCPNCGAKMDNV